MRNLKLEEILSRWGDNVKNTPIYDVLVSVYGDNGAKSLEIKFMKTKLFLKLILLFCLSCNSRGIATFSRIKHRKSMVLHY